MKGQVFVVNTLYHLYISLLKAYETRNRFPETDLTIIITDYLPQADSYIGKLKKLNLWNNVFSLPDKANGKKYSEPFRIIERVLRRKYLLHKLYQNTADAMIWHLLDQSDINLFVDSTQFVQYLFYKYPLNTYRLFEDGERIYLVPKTTAAGLIKHKFLNYPLKYGRDSQIKEILVQHPEKLPRNIKSKGVRLEYKEISKALPGKQLRLIKDFFLPGKLEIKKSGNNLLLLTQPLSEDGYISEGYKKDLYKRILEEFGYGFNIFIKPHPRETTNYANFANAQLIPGDFPFEIMNYLTEYQFKRGVTLFSTALNNALNIEEKVFLGLSWDKKVADAFPFRE